jgi:hypothetical protein
MKADKDKSDRVEQALAEAYRRQRTSGPSEAWHKDVMENIQAQSAPNTVVFPIEVRTAWYAACTAAAAAVIAVAVGVLVMPSDARLAWQLQQDGVVSEWILQTGE